MDPFVQIEYKGKTFKTQTIQEGGKNPVWNEAFVIPINSMDDEFKITCFDEDLLVDDLVGSKVFKASELCSNLTATQNWLHLNYKNNKAVEVFVETKFLPNPKAFQSRSSISIAPPINVIDVKRVSQMI